jgi:hypothetical protein
VHTVSVGRTRGRTVNSVAPCRIVRFRVPKQKGLCRVEGAVVVLVEV